MFRDSFVCLCLFFSFLDSDCVQKRSIEHCIKEYHHHREKKKAMTTTTQTPTPTTLDDLLSNSFEENDALLSRAGVRKHLFSSSQSRFVEDLMNTTSSKSEEDEDSTTTVFSRLRMNERTIALMRLVELANGEEEEKEERAGEEEEKEEEEKRKKSERTAQKKTKRKKSKDGLGGPNWSGKRNGEEEEDGSVSLVSEKEGLRFLEMTETCVLFAKEEEYREHLAKASACAKKAFAVVARSYVKTLREMGRLERALEPLKYALKMYSTTVSRKKVTFLHAVYYEVCAEMNRESEAYEGELLFAVEDPSETGFRAKDFANYCYYAGLSCLSKVDYERAISFFSNCISMPTKEKCARVQMESYKKLVLASIIQTGETSTFLSENNGIPAKTSNVVRQALLHQSTFVGGVKREGDGGGGGNESEIELATMIGGDLGAAEDPNKKKQSKNSSQDDEMKNADEHEQRQEGNETPQKVKVKFEEEGGSLGDYLDSTPPPPSKGADEEDMGADEEMKRQQQNRSPYRLLIEALSHNWSRNVKRDYSTSTPLKRFTETMKEYSTIFENDRNADLVVLAHKSVQLAQVRKVAETYSSLSLEAIARELHLGGGENEAKVLVNEMAARSNIRGGVSAKIDDQNMVTFHDQVCDKTTRQEKLDKAMADIEQMRALIKQFDESMITDEEYFAKFYERQMDKRNGSVKGGGKVGRRAPLSALAAMTTASIEGGGDEDIAMF